MKGVLSSWHKQQFIRVEDHTSQRGEAMIMDKLLAGLGLDRRRCSVEGELEGALHLTGGISASFLLQTLS